VGSLISTGSFDMMKWMIAYGNSFIKAEFSIQMSMVSAIPRKHALAFQRRPSLAFGCGTY
jgi:hypothetical protein